MPSAVRLREDYSAEELRTLARRSKDVSQSRRLLSLAAVRDGMDRAAAAKIGGMDRQTLREFAQAEGQKIGIVELARRLGTDSSNLRKAIIGTRDFGLELQSAARRY
jgi:hypothetical protein